MIATPLALLATTLLAAQPLPRPPAADPFRPDPAWKPLAPSLWFDPNARALVIRARVVLREGPLEHLLCLKGTKEHESILATRVGAPDRGLPAADPPARPPAAAPAARRPLSYAEMIRAALVMTRAEPGRPVQFVPEFAPPTGTPIAITLEWEQGGATHRADARDWVMDERRCYWLTWAAATAGFPGASAAGAAAAAAGSYFATTGVARLASEPLCVESRDWVFAGSRHEMDPVSKEPYFLADDGDLITVANFASAILDLPFASSASDADRVFVARTSQVPPLGTGVTMTLRPRNAPPPR